MKRIIITQKDGVVSIYDAQSGDLEVKYNFNGKDRMSVVTLANWVAEIMYDCINGHTITRL